MGSGSSFEAVSLFFDCFSFFIDHSVVREESKHPTLGLVDSRTYEEIFDVARVFEEGQSVVQYLLLEAVTAIAGFEVGNPPLRAVRSS